MPALLLPFAAQQLRLGGVLAADILDSFRDTTQNPSHRDVAMSPVSVTEPLQHSVMRFRSEVSQWLGGQHEFLIQRPHQRMTEHRHRLIGIGLPVGYLFEQGVESETSHPPELRIQIRQITNYLTIRGQIVQLPVDMIERLLFQFDTGGHRDRRQLILQLRILIADRAEITDPTRAGLNPTHLAPLFQPTKYFCHFSMQLLLLPDTRRITT
jgi:hypothetical protein